MKLGCKTETSIREALEALWILQRMNDEQQERVFVNNKCLFALCIMRVIDCRKLKRRQSGIVHLSDSYDWWGQLRNICGFRVSLILSWLSFERGSLSKGSELSEWKKRQAV